MYLGDIYSKSREKVKAEARGLFCYWAVRELGYSMLEIAGLLGMSQPGVVYAVRRGEHIAQERGIKLTLTLHKIVSTGMQVCLRLLRFLDRCWMLDT